MDMAAVVVKWGILGCADIARKNCVAVAEASNAVHVAVASRDKAKAERWAAENCPGARAYGSYQELLDDNEVQVVYIPLPTALRAEWVLKAAAKKKHVLCEKPIAKSAEEAKRIIDACHEAGVQFMDNTMFMHHDRMAAMKRFLTDEALFGVPSHVVSNFSINFGNDEEWLKKNIRSNKATEPFGALGDLGWYCLRFSAWAFDELGSEEAPGALPAAVSCNYLHKSSDGVPLGCTATLRWPSTSKCPGGRVATFDCSFMQAFRQSAEVVGQKCSLRLDDLVVNADDDNASFTVRRGSIGDKALLFPSEVVATEVVRGCKSHVKLVERLSGIAASGELERYWPAVSLYTQVVMLALEASARRRGAWTSPRYPALSSKGKGKGRGEGATEMRKAKFGKVAKVKPGAKGLNLQVVVVSVEQVSGPTPSTAAVVGDESGVVTLVATGEHQVGLVKAGASLLIRNASVRMHRGFVRLQVDKWGKLEHSAEIFAITPNAAVDISATEYELVGER